MPDRYSLVRAVGARDPGAAGYILAALSLGSALGGLAGGSCVLMRRAAFDERGN